MEAESQSLLDECAEWVAAQLEEENVFIDPGLVSLIMEMERQDDAPRGASSERAAEIVQRLADQGVRGVPDAIDARLLLIVLQWEDEFMALAGRPRPV